MNNRNDEINQIFQANNDISVVYNNENEEKITEYCNVLKENNDLDDVICYGNTINEQLTYNDVNNKLKDLEINTTIDDYILKLIYYRYYSAEEDQISYSDFIGFVNNTIYQNEDIDISQETKDKISSLENFTDKNKVIEQKSSSELSEILNIEATLIDKLIIYYNGVKNNSRITLKDFIYFMNNYIVGDSTYSINNETKNKINYLSSIISKAYNSYSSEELSSILSISKEDVDKLIIYDLTTRETSTSFTIKEFTDIIINNYNSFKDYITQDNYNNITLLNKFSDKNFINTDLKPADLANLFSVSIESINHNFLEINRTKLSPKDFVQFMLNKKLISDQNKLAKFNLLNQVMDSTNNDVRYDYVSISKILGISESSAKTIYSYYDSLNYRLTLKDFVNIASNNPSVNNDNLKSLNSILSALDNRLTASQLSNILSIDIKKTRLIYGLYDFKYRTDTISTNNLIKFIQSDVINDSEYNSNFDETSISKLEGINEIIDAVLEDKKVTSSEMISSLNKIITADSSTIELVYSYYQSVHDVNENWTMTIEQIINYSNDDLLQDYTVDKYVKDDMKTEIKNARESINDTKKALVGPTYSRMIIKSKLDAEGNKAYSLVEDIKNNIKDMDAYIVGSSNMSLEMKECIDKELILITLLMLLLTYVVASLALKKIIIPLVLVLFAQCSIFITINGLAVIYGSEYFIYLLIMQAILIGITVYYSIAFTSSYIESRKTKDVRNSMKLAYKHASHIIITSSLVLISSTLVVSLLANTIASKLCEIIAEGALCSLILTIFVLPSVVACLDRLTINKKRNKQNTKNDTNVSQLDNSDTNVSELDSENT